MEIISLKTKQSLVFSIVILSQSLRAMSTPLTKWEQLDPNEAKEMFETGDLLIGQARENYSKKNLRVLRDAHPHAIACVAASFKVNDDIPIKYQTGVFSQPGKTYDSLIRFSSSFGPTGDNAKDARGLAIKLFGVPGTKLLADQPNAQTQDFIHIDHPIFPARNAHQFEGIIKIGGDKSYIGKFLLEDPIRNAMALKNLADMINNPNNGTGLLEHKYFSMVPYLFKGSSIETPIKFSTRPCGPVAARALSGGENELRDDLQARLKEGEGCFDFAIQLYNEAAGFEVENGSNLWPEDKSPFIRLARITIPRQAFVTDEKLAYCDALSYQPWHALPAHQPIGNINRTRKVVYETISKFRHATNGDSALQKEPEGLGAWNAFKSDKYVEWLGYKFPAHQ